MRSNQRQNMKWINRFLIILFICGSCIHTSFAQTKDITLRQAIQLSIINSHHLQASDARVLQATARLKEAGESRLPEVSATGSMVYLNNPDFSLKTGKPQGGNDSAAGFPKIHEATYGILNASLPIFTGGKIKYGIESAKFLQRAAILQASDDTASVVLNTIEAYVNLYKSIATVKVVKDNLRKSLHRDSVLIRLENNGLLARNDRLKAQLQSSQIELSLLEAESNSNLATINMNLMLGLPENTILNPDSTDFNFTEENLVLSDLLQNAPLSRNDFQSLKQKENAAQSGVQAAKADWYPNIALTGGYIAAYIPHFLTITNALNIGVGIKYSISSLWKTKSKIAEASAKLKEVRANELQLANGIILQINKDFENFSLQKKKIEVYKIAQSQAEENFRITNNKYQNDLVNMQEVLDANLLLLQSHINIALAKADLLLSYERLLKSTGKLSYK